jgi:hypothetical protein
MNEVQYLLTPQPTRFVPHHVSQHTGNGSHTERGEEAQLSGGGEGPDRKQKQRPRHRQTDLVGKHDRKQNGVAMLENELEDDSHIEIGSRNDPRLLTNRG